MSPVCVLGRFMIVYVCIREVTCDVCICLLLISCSTSSWSGGSHQAADAGSESGSWKVRGSP